MLQPQVRSSNPGIASAEKMALQVHDGVEGLRTPVVFEKTQTPRSLHCEIPYISHSQATRSSFFGFNFKLE